MATAAKKAKTTAWQDVGEKNKGLAALLVRKVPDAGAPVVMGFDIDSTVIKTKSGRTFGKDMGDWMFWNPVVPKKLKALHDSGAHVVFFTNQAGVKEPKGIQGKIDAIIEALGFEVTALVVPDHNQYRKPSVRLWQYFVEHLNNGVAVDMAKSLYVGDAAGRNKDWAPGMPRDFSCSDRQFAANVGIPFATPEAFFLGQPEAPFAWRSFDPRSVVDSSATLDEKALTADGQEMVLMVGCPASGKSTVSKRFFHEKKGYELVNRDTLGTPAKCQKAAQAALAVGKSVVIDNTNPDKASRAAYIKLAQKAKVPVRCVQMTTSRELATHLNFYRAVMTHGAVRRIPAVAYNSFFKKFEEPQPSEGFAAVLKVDFVPQFADAEARELFLHWQPTQ